MGIDGKIYGPFKPGDLTELPPIHAANLFEKGAAAEAKNSDEDIKTKIRAVAISEYGINGWVDPLKIVQAVGISESQAMLELGLLGYERYERSGGIGYRQKKRE